jgi:flagellar L-ring protein FlgH
MKLLSSLLLVMLAPLAAFAQDSSLMLATPVMANPQQAPVATLETCSYIFSPLPPEAEMRELKIGSIVTILVDERSSMLSEGDAESRKTMSINSVLASWIAFDGEDIFLAPQRRGDPRIQASKNSQYRAESDVETRDSLTFRIAANVADIRPNGNLVLEAHKHIYINDVEWETSITGECARQSIGLDRTVRSDAIANPHIVKRELGQVRDGYAPGWFTKLYGKYKAF